MRNPLVRPGQPETKMDLVGVPAYGVHLAVMLSRLLEAHSYIPAEPVNLAGLLAAGDAAVASLAAAKKPKLNEIAQVVVFASGGVTNSVAIRDLPDGDVPCIVLDYDDRQDDAGDVSPEDFERKKLGIGREEFDKQATYIW